MIHVVLATRNAHKVAEIRDLLPPHLHYFTLADLRDPPQVIEDADSFAGNATKKAVEIARWIAGQPALARSLTQPDPAPELYVLADDSGLEVDALNGAPGVHSARFASEELGLAGNSPDAANNAKLLKLLESVPIPNRSARFRCVIALAPVVVAAATTASPVCSADEIELQVQLFEGACEGQIASAPSGQRGFGYDPLFVPTGFDQSFAELGEPLKNQISHRAKALKQLRERFIRPTDH